MKKRFLSGIFAFALLATAGYGINKSMNSNAGLSNLALVNIEALANGEIPPEGKCLTDQTQRRSRIGCYGNMMDIIVYDFSCVGSGGNCIGAIGFEGWCMDEFKTTLSIESKPC